MCVYVCVCVCVCVCVSGVERGGKEGRDVYCVHPGKKATGSVHFAELLESDFV